MALSNSLKESIAEVLNSTMHYDRDYINDIIESVEASFYKKKSVTTVPQTKSAPAVVESKEVDPKQRMKEILLSGTNGSTGLSVPQPQATIQKTSSAMAGMARILR